MSSAKPSHRSTQRQLVLLQLSLTSTFVDIGFDTSRHRFDDVFPLRHPIHQFAVGGNPIHVWQAACVVKERDHQGMFKISIVETRGRRRLILEGKLIQPWTAELESAWRNAAQQLEGRKLVIDLTNVTLINRDGEDALFELMRDGAKFCSGDVVTKHVLKQLARRCRVE